MKNIAPKLTTEEYEANFKELHPPMSHHTAVAEANRCLFCYDSPCTKACPTHIDIPAFIKKISTGNLKGSAKTILESNWLALTCARACPVEELCEGACVFNQKGEKPIEIGRLQRYAIEDYFSKGMAPLFSPTAKNGKSVGVIGAGAAGLACAAESALLGFDVTIYDARPKPGGLNTWGIAPYKTTQQDSLKEVALIQSLGVKIKSSVTVGVDVSIDDLMKNHDALFLGLGLPKAVPLKVVGENLKGVFESLEFIEKVSTREWRKVDVGRRVAVIGGGNTAIDAATEAMRLGAEEVIIFYRRSRNEMPAYDFEFELAKSDGILFHFLTAPVRIIGNESVESIECIRMKLGDLDEEGRRKPIPIPNSEFTIPVDMVITSIGQDLDGGFLEKIPGVKVEKGKIVVDPETMQTSNPRFFAGGDCINGGKEVVNAAADGKKAAHGIHKYLLKTT